MDPDLSYRKEAAWQSQEANNALSAQPSPNDNATSLPSFLPSSSDVASCENSNLDDELWDELMGVSDTEMTEPQSGTATTTPDSGTSGPDEEEEEDDEMIAMLTESLDRELEEMQGAQQLAAQKEAAESARKKALLEEQMRVAAEKLALATQFDYLHEPPKKKSKAAAIRIRRAIRRPGLIDRSSRFDRGLGFDTSRVVDDRSTRRRALKNDRPPEPIPKTTIETPASNSGERTPSAAGTSVQSTQELPRVYHQTDSINWELLWDRMSLSKFHVFHISSSRSYPGAPLTVHISHEP